MTESEVNALVDARIALWFEQFRHALEVLNYNTQFVAWQLHGCKPNMRPTRPPRPPLSEDERAAIDKVLKDFL